MIHPVQRTLPPFADSVPLMPTVRDNHGAFWETEESKSEEEQKSCLIVFLVHSVLSPTLLYCTSIDGRAPPFFDFFILSFASIQFSTTNERRAGSAVQCS